MYPKITVLPCFSLSFFYEKQKNNNNLYRDKKKNEIIYRVDELLDYFIEWDLITTQIKMKIT
jgi:hypothetical protein